MKAWLYRKGKSKWEFKYCWERCALVHVTRAGTVYAILSSVYDGRPFWLAKQSIDILGNPIWAPQDPPGVALKIEFEDAGTYFFSSAEQGVR
jgi:hypothetical protein